MLNKNYHSPLKAKKTALSLTLGLLIMGLSGCTTTPPKQAIDTNHVVDTLNNGIQSNQQLDKRTLELNDSISSALLPRINLRVNDKRKDNQRFDMVINNAPIKAFFESLAKDTNNNIIVSPEVSGNISLDVKHMTLDDILQALHSVYGYRYTKNNYGYTIYPNTIETRVFHVSYLDMERTGTSQTSISSGQIVKNTSTSSTADSSTSSSTDSSAPASTVITKSQNQFWKELSTGISMIIGQPEASTPTTATASSSATQTPQPLAANTTASVLTNAQAGLVIVRAYPDQLKRVAQYIREVQTIMHREVMIDAKILEVDLNADYQSGIDWTILGAKQSGTGQLSRDLLAIGDNNFSLQIGGLGGNFNTTMKLLNTQGRVNILSSPHITTVNNQKALIKIGDDDYYITGISSSTSTNAATTTSESVDLTPFFSGIALDVTPEIDTSGDITLHIHPIVSTVTNKPTSFNTAAGNGREQTIPLASSSVRESDNIVRVRNNQVIMIGGLMEMKSYDYTSGLPVVSKIPGLGNLFKKQNKLGKKTELIILLQPKLITDDSTQQILQDTAQRYADMKDDFSFDTTINPTNP